MGWAVDQDDGRKLRGKESIGASVKSEVSARSERECGTVRRSTQERILGICLAKIARVADLLLGTRTNNDDSPNEVTGGAESEKHRSECLSAGKIVKTQGSPS